MLHIRRLRPSQDRTGSSTTSASRSGFVLRLQHVRQVQFLVQRASSKGGDPLFFNVLEWTKIRRMQKKASEMIELYTF